MDGGGIHVDGVKKNPKTYEPYNPDLVGATRKIIIGKHSGPKAVYQKIRELGGCLDTEIANLAVLKIRNLAATQKGGVSDEQILGMLDIHNTHFRFDRSLQH